MSGYSILFVCMGNICRSPTAEGVFGRVLRTAGLDSQVALDSAGTHGYHVGESPDSRAVAAAGAREIDIAGLRARKVSADDFYRFDLILAMDADNLRLLDELAPDDAKADLRLMLDFSSRDPGGAVPDPYYGGEAGFERVLDLLEEAGEGLLAHLQTRLPQ